MNIKTVTICGQARWGEHWWWMLLSTENGGKLVGYSCHFCGDYSESKR